MVAVETGKAEDNEPSKSNINPNPTIERKLQRMRQSIRRL